MGPKIGKDWKPQLTHLVGPCKEGRDIVYRNSEKDSIILVENFFHNIISRPLIGANRCPGRGNKGEDDILFPTILSQRNFFSRNGRKSEVRSQVPNFYF